MEVLPEHGQLPAYRRTLRAPHFKWHCRASAARGGGNGIQRAQPKGTHALSLAAIQRGMVQYLPETLHPQKACRTADRCAHGLGITERRLAMTREHYCQRGGVCAISSRLQSTARRQASALPPGHQWVRIAVLL